MTWDCTTWLETYGSGAGTGMGRTQPDRRMTPKDPPQARTGRGGVVVGTILRTPSASRTDTTSSQTIWTIRLASASSCWPMTLRAAVAGEGVGTFTVNGAVTSDGGSPVTARGVIYGLTPEPTMANAMTSPAGAGSGAFASALTDLTLDVTYYARAYATNAIGTRFGAEITFKTAKTPTGFCLISEGAFAMGDSLDGLANAPVRQVTLNAFYLAQHETTKALWDSVREWGASQGYTDLPDGNGKSADHPVQ